MSKGGRYLQKKAPKETMSAGSEGKMSKKKKTVLIILTVILALLIAMIAGGIIYFNSMLNLVRRPEKVEQVVSEEEFNKLAGVIEETEATEATAPTETEPVSYGATGKIVNILVIGQAAREGEDAKLSDTMILCTINKETKTLTLTSFLRDTYVQLPSPYKGHTCGKNRINTAYALGYLWGKEAEAMEYMDLTILNNFGAQVDYNVEIDFEAFEKIIDLMDGVKLDLDADEAKYMNDFFAEYNFGKTFKEGSNLMNGWEALVYARMRHSSGADNDFKRTNRQRVLISKLVDKCKRRTLTQLNDIAKEVLPYILTDMTNEQITTCMLELIPMLPELQVESNQCPAPDTFWGEVITIADVESGVLKFDMEKNKQIMMDIAEADRFDPVG